MRESERNTKYVRIGKVLFTFLLGSHIFYGIHSAQALERGDLAPNFVLPLLTTPNDTKISGAQFDLVALDDYQGRYVFLYFFQSDCVSCRQAAPILNALQQDEQTGGIEFLGVSTDTLPQDALAYLASSPVTYPVASDPGSYAADLFGVKGVPTVFVINAQGRVKAVHEGGFDHPGFSRVRASLNSVKGGSGYVRKKVRGSQ